ncbi:MULTISPECIES: helix-turn-helix domain-containing protein [Saliphagus]|uniref:Helix-turn-helix domain-containing protein n=1 Tax=Saliphagus infecundisoli TaxID=1849069 RepID=A0ABD5QJ06_9EURY|nr:MULTISPECIES: helix-turn-helix domain-containing protein [Saliphagus]
MSGTIVEVGLALEDLSLEHTLTAIEGLECEVERLVADDEARVMPFLWVEAPDLEGLDEVFEEDDTVDEVSLVTDLGTERLYRMEWVARIDALVRILVEENGTVLSARADAEGWSLRLLFPTREAVSRTHSYCREKEIGLEIRTIYSLDDGRQGRFDLTDGQQDVLVAAYERGYYEIPRDADLEDLAAEFDISHQALSERLRRAHRSLVENTVIIGEEAHGP